MPWEAFSIKRAGRRAYCFTAALLLLMTVGGEALSQEKKKSPLKVELSTPAAALCPEGSLELEMQLTNQLKETIRVDKADLWSSFSYGKLRVTNAEGELIGSGGGMVYGCDHCRGDYIVISPGETFWTKHTFALEADFFGNAGKYSLQTRVRYELADKKDLSADSNEIEFELFECTSK